MKRRAIWATLAGLLVGLLTASAARADPAALFSYPDADESKVDASYAETVDSMFRVMVVIGETGDGKSMVCQSRLLSNKITFQKQ
jgi:hypothetical protein